MSERDEWLTVRRLPDGEARPGRRESLDGRRLEATLVGEPGGGDEFHLRAPVEVECEQFLYLGEVVGRHGALLIIVIEHAVNRTALAAIDEVWRGPRKA